MQRLRFAFSDSQPDLGRYSPPGLGRSGHRPQLAAALLRLQFQERDAAARGIFGNSGQRGHPPLGGRNGKGKRNRLRNQLGRRAALLLLLLAALLSQAACGDGETRQVRGQVVEVSARNFAELETLRIRDDAGREYRFIAEGFIGFTPSHVREHQLLGQSLLVTYEQRGDELVAIALAD